MMTAGLYNPVILHILQNTGYLQFGRIASSRRLSLQCKRVFHSSVSHERLSDLLRL